jgi:hypothetical protein
MHLVGYLYKDYHDARSLEHKVKRKNIFVVLRTQLAMCIAPYSHKWSGRLHSIFQRYLIKAYIKKTLVEPKMFVLIFIYHNCRKHFSF